ncbi:hypothetical protein ACJJTC_009041 [Scirpophaga incertulas]
MLGNMEFVETGVQISMDVGVGNSRRYIDVSRLYETLGSPLAKSLPAFHAMTGCDYNPALYRKVIQLRRLQSTTMQNGIGETFITNKIYCTSLEQRSYQNPNRTEPCRVGMVYCGWYEDEGRFQFSWFSGNQLPELSDVIFDDKSSSTTEEDVEDLLSDVESDFEDDDSESDSD